MKISYHTVLFVLIMLLSLVLLGSTLIDIVSGGEFLFIILAIYAVLIVSTILLLFIFPAKKRANESEDIVEVFEKTLEGKLHHFKCPNCQGIFAIKKSSQNNKQPFTLTCPDCGSVGKISPSAPKMVESIPEKKSEKIKFKCKQCGETVSLWAEGRELVAEVKVYSCPYCGEQHAMNSV